MKALTIRQPWASLIALGVKTIETRSWRAPQSLIGQTIAIHAGKWTPRIGAFAGPIHEGPDGGYEYAMLRDRDGERPWKLWSPEGWMTLPLGAVVATATLAGCLPMVDNDTGNNRPKQNRYVYMLDDEAMAIDLTLTAERYTSITDQLPYGDFAPGRWAWMLTNVQPCEPIPAKGKQGLWEWNP